MRAEYNGDVRLDRSALETAIKLRDLFEGKLAGGIFGVSRTMPEEEAVREIADPLDRVRMISFTVAIDYQRDATRLWDQARRLYLDEQTRWVFDPFRVIDSGLEKTCKTIESKGKLRYRNKDAKWWMYNARIWAIEYQGDPRILFEKYGWNADRIRRAVVREKRFKGLGGQKIFPLWLRILSDIEKFNFEGFDILPIPVDVHIARSTFTLGLLRGRHVGVLDNQLQEKIRYAWKVVCDENGEVPITFDEALWQLSRLGCKDRHRNGYCDCKNRSACPIGAECMKGVINVTTAEVRIFT